MSFIPARTRAAAVLVVAVAIWAALAATAVAATSTITRSDCLNGRISRNGKAISQSECLRHVGQNVNLAHTGFDAWIIAAAGGVCLAGAAALRLRPRLRNTRA